MFMKWKCNAEYVICHHALYYSEDRAAKSLLATAQYNRKKGHEPIIPEQSDKLMSKDRKTRVRNNIFKNANQVL